MLLAYHSTSHFHNFFPPPPPHSFYHFYSCPESVVVVESLGVQVCTTYWWGYSSSLFFPHTIIGDIIINEAIVMVTV